jgi:type II secretory pathway pseudopilin PulG
MSLPSPFTRNPKPFTGGFTLIELLVTVSIFIFMTALIVSRYGAFNQGTLMTNLAYDVALTIRTAQTYGVSVKGIEDSSVNAGSGFYQTFTGSYGINFDISDSSNVNSFFMFIDSNGNNVYNEGIDAKVSSYILKQGVRISQLCASVTGGMGSNPCANGTQIIDIAFKRPDPAAIISVNGSQTQPNPPYNFVRITLTSADGSSLRTIVVRGNGQISVSN